MSRDDSNARPQNMSPKTDAESEWNERYASREQMWSGRPNATLTQEASSLTPGRALDVGAGEGADAIWLALRGWTVTGLELSGVAIERAQGHAAREQVHVDWHHAGLLDATLDPGAFDLVTVHYLGVPRSPENLAETALISLVAVGGTFLMVQHAFDEHHPAHHAGRNPHDTVSIESVVAVMGRSWKVLVNEDREREAPASGAGSHHRNDQVLRAIRLS
jgi:SAM-dependent methyltransferase